MSSERRASSASSPRRVSRRLRSRMSGWEREASAQTVGSAIFSSITESSRWSRAESKILPQIAHFVTNRGVGVFEVAKHMNSSLRQLGPNIPCSTRFGDDLIGIGRFRRRVRLTVVPVSHGQFQLQIAIPQGLIRVGTKIVTE